MSQAGTWKTFPLVFDTDQMLYRDDGFLSWNVSRVTPITAGSVYIPPHISTIRAMRFAPCTFSGLYGLSDFVFNRWVIGVREFISDSFLVNNERFHFYINGSRLSVNPSNNTYYEYIDGGGASMLEMETHNNNKGMYEFDTPIRVPDSFTFSFSNLVHQLPLNGQETVWRVTQQSNPMVLTRVGPWYYTPYETIGTPVTISGFTTGDPVTDAATIAAVNTTHEDITVGVPPTSIVFDLIDLSATTATAGDVDVVLKTANHRRVYHLTLYY